MNVIATTSHSVLLVDCMTGHASALHRGEGLYYGIARMDSAYAVAARRRYVSGPIPHADERGCILVFDRLSQAPRVLEAPFAMRDIHQIAWFDGRLWVTCSLDDLIAVFDGVAWERWTPLEAGPVGDDGLPVSGKDRYHYNSFHVSDGEFAILAHNLGPSDIHFFDRRTRSLKRSVRLGRQAHNIWSEKDAYFTCSSIEGKLVASDGWELATGGFPRGVCVGETHRAVGISALAERGRRDWASAAIALYDSSWRPVHYVHLVREGMILDLALVPDDLAMHDGPGERDQFPLLMRLSDADLAGA